jgi:hypothetical protein
MRILSSLIGAVLNLASGLGVMDEGREFVGGGCSKLGPRQPTMLKQSWRSRMRPGHFRIVAIFSHYATSKTDGNDFILQLKYYRGSLIPATFRRTRWFELFQESSFIPPAAASLFRADSLTVPLPLDRPPPYAVSVGLIILARSKSK